jgi:outer membrane protein assembly factor BamB
MGSEGMAQLSAYSATGGQRFWKTTFGRGVVQGSPVVANGVAYVVTDEGTLHPVSAQSGRQLFSWTAPFSGIANSGSPTVVNGKLYVAFADGVVAFGLP